MPSNVLTDDEARRQTNGRTGERRTLAALEQHLWVMPLNADLDSADLLIADPRPTNAEERERRTGASISVQGVVQCKYFEQGNAVYIDNEYVEDCEGPRKGFFLHVHTNDGDFNPISYFLFSEDVFNLPFDESRNRRRFSITKKDTKEVFLVKSNRVIINRIKADLAGLEQFELDRRALPYILRARFILDEEIEYHLRLVQVNPSELSPQNDEVRVILARTKDYARPLDARTDLQLGGDTFWWGNLGGGSKLSALTILAHHLGGLPPSRQQFIAFREVISGLACNCSHVISGTVVNSCL